MKITIYPKKNMMRDCMVNFNVNLDFRGFLKYTNNNINIQKKSRILQPIKIA